MSSRPITPRFEPSRRLSRRVAILAVPPTNELDVVGPFQVFGTVNRLFGQGGTPYRVEVVCSVRRRSMVGYSGLSILSHSFYRDLSGTVDTLLFAGGLGLVLDASGGC